jgi:peptide/nickel transport system substrate-binding protein
MKKVRVILMIILTTSLLFGCTKNILNNDKKENEVVSAINSENINLSMIQPTTLNPILNNYTSVDYVMKLVYEGLFKIDKNYNVVPQLVESYNFSNGGTSLNITLKDSSWHDGQKLVASDVKFTIDTIKQYDESPYKPLVENISSVQVSTSKDLTINFTNSYAFSVETLTFPIIPKHILDGLDDEKIKSDRSNLIGSGHYKIEKYEPRSYMLLSPNKDYYEKIPEDARNIRVSIVPDEEAQVTMTMALETDITKVSLQDLASFTDNEFRTISYEGRGFENMVLNFNNPYINDINFRKALVHAIDRDSIVKEAYIEQAQRTGFALYPTSKYYNKDLKPYPYNKKKAKEFLKKVSEKNTSTQNNINNEENKNNENNTNNNENKNIITSKKKVELKLIVNKDNFERIKASYTIRDNLADIGIKVTTLELSEDEITQALLKGEYDIALIGWELSHIPDPSFIINSINYQDEKLSQYLQDTLVYQGKQADIESYHKLQKYVRDKILFIPLAVTNDNIVVNKRIKGNFNSNDFDIYEGIESLDIEK